MSYIYFDINGRLREYVTTPKRKGSENVDTLCVYWEGNDGTVVLPSQCFIEYGHESIHAGPLTANKISRTIIPFERERDLKFFQYGKTYQFMCFDLPTAVSSTSGFWHSSVSIHDRLSNNVVQVLGDITFEVEESSIVPSGNLDLSQYNYILDKIKDVERNLDSKLDKTTPTSIINGNGDKVVDFASDKVTIHKKAQSIEIPVEAKDITNKEYVDSNIYNSIPKGTYDTLQDLNTAFPTGASGVYIVRENNHWYYWNGSAWIDGGEYFASNIDAKYVVYDNSQSDDYLEATNVQDAIDELTKKSKIPSTNLYNYKIAIDQKLVSANMAASSLDTYPNSILSGFVPVEEGKSYVIKPNGSLSCGALFFWDENKQGICAIDINDAKYGFDPFFWTAIDGLAEVSGTIYERKIKILPNSGIKYVLFYVTNSTWNNYYGAHTDYLNIVKTIQINEGTEALPFEPYEIAVADVVEENEKNIERLEKRLINKDEKVYLVKNGDFAYFRSKFSQTKDLLWKTGLHSSTNNTFNLMFLKELDNYTPKENVEDVGEIFKMVGDDVSPVYVNYAYSYLGANHGNSGVQKITFANAHNLTEKNIGEYWTDASNEAFLILRIIDDHNINVAKWTNSSPENFQYNHPTSHLSNGTNTYNISSSVYVTDVPCCNNIEVKLFDEAGNEITDNGVYYGKSFQVRERYNIISVSGIVNYLVSNVGNNTNASCYSDDIEDYFCEIENIYEFKGEKGALTYYRDIYIDKTGKYEIAGISSGKIGEYYSVPYSNASAITHQGSNENVLIETSDYTDANYPPASFYQYSSSNGTRGTNIGYNVDFGSAKVGTRKNAIEYAINYYTGTYKMYPALSRINVDAGTNISTIAYQTFFDNYDSDVPAITWYYVGKDIYMNINCQATVNKNIELPYYMIGKKVTVVKTDGNISIGTDFINANGLRIKTTGYGFATLKLN